MTNTHEQVRAVAMIHDLQAGLTEHDAMRLIHAAKEHGIKDFSPVVFTDAEEDGLMSQSYALIYASYEGDDELVEAVITACNDLDSIPEDGLIPYANGVLQVLIEERHG